MAKNKYSKGITVGPAPMIEGENPNNFYFGRENFKWMLIGLGLIVLGFLLMLGGDANTVDGVRNPDVWNEDIFSFRRIRLAPIVVLAGFCVEAYAIVKRFPTKNSAEV